MGSASFSSCHHIITPLSLRHLVWGTLPSSLCNQATLRQFLHPWYGHGRLRSMEHRDVAWWRFGRGMRWLGVKCWKRHPAVLDAVTLKPGSKIIMLWQGAGWCVGSVRRFYAPGSRGCQCRLEYIELLYSDGQRVPIMLYPYIVIA